MSHGRQKKESPALSMRKREILNARESRLDVSRKKSCAMRSPKILSWRPSPSLRAQHRGDDPSVHHTSVFHYVMDHCNAQSYHGRMEQCRWVSYNTSAKGLREGESVGQTNARARAVRSSFRNQRKRPQAELLIM